MKNLETVIDYLGRVQKRFHTIAMESVDEGCVGIEVKTRDILNLSEQLKECVRRLENERP